jgi:hypothetical protein
MRQHPEANAKLETEGGRDLVSSDLRRSAFPIKLRIHNLLREIEAGVCDAISGK